MAVDGVDPQPPLFGGGTSGNVPVEITTPLTIVQGGTGALNPTGAAHNILNLPGTAAGDIYYRSSATTVARRPAGTNGHVLTMVSGLPNWAAPTGGDGSGGLPLAGGAITGSAPGSLVIGSPVDGSLGPGTLNTGSTIQVNASTAPASVLPSGTLMHVEGDINARILVTGWGGAATLMARSALGTGASPAPLSATNSLGVLAFGGYAPNGWAALPSRRAGIEAQALENWTNTAQGSQLSFDTTSVGTTVDIARMRLAEGLVIGTPTDGDKGPGSINAQSIWLNGTSLGATTGLPLTGGTISGTPGSLVIGNPVDGSLGPGTLNTSSIIQVNASTALASALPSGTLMHVEGDTNARILITGWSGNATITARSSTGTGASPVALTAGDSLGILAFSGYASNGWASAPARRAGIEALALEPWTNLAQGSQLSFDTTALGTTTITERMRLAQGLVVGNPAGGTNGDLGPGTINATGYYLEGSPLATSAAGAISLTVGSLVAEEITLDGTPMVPLAGGDPGEVVTKLADGSIAWTRIGEPGGLVIGNPTGGAKGAGTLNIQGGIYQNGDPFVSGSGGAVWGAITGSIYNQGDLLAELNVVGLSFAQSFAWTDGINPDNVCMYVNNTGEELSIRAITGVIEVDNGAGAAAGVRVVRAAVGNPLTSGQDVSNPFDVEQPAGTVESLNVLEAVLEPSWRLGLRITGTWQDSVATITVHLGPPIPTSGPTITSPLVYHSEINAPFSYQIVAPGATGFNADVPPPVGLTVNMATGLISGTPTVLGVTNVTISASNAVATSTETLVVTILRTQWDVAPRAHANVEFFDGAIWQKAVGSTRMRAPGGTYVSCLSTTSRNSGNYYVEFHFSNTVTAWAGIATNTANLGNYLSNNSGSAGIWYQGSSHSSRISIGPGGSWADFTLSGVAGSYVIGMAFQIGGKMWFRNVTLDGGWTGFAPQSMDGDPTEPGGPSATNGRSINWVTGGPPYYLMASSGNNGEVTVCAGPATGGIGTPPVGYSWWES